MFIDEMIDTNTEHGKEMTYRILRKVADDREMVDLKKEKIELSIQEVVTPRDIVGTGTNGICRFASTLKALRPDVPFFQIASRPNLYNFKEKEILS